MTNEVKENPPLLNAIGLKKILPCKKKACLQNHSK